jgi:hypothetical protein
MSATHATAATATATAVQTGYVLGGDIGTGKSSLTSLVGATLVSHMYRISNCSALLASATSA